MKPLYKERCLLSIDVEELGLGMAVTNQPQVLIHDFASLEVLVIEVHHRQFVFCNVVEEFSFDNLHQLVSVPLCIHPHFA